MDQDTPNHLVESCAHGRPTHSVPTRDPIHDDPVHGEEGASYDQIAIELGEAVDATGAGRAQYRGGVAVPVEYPAVVAGSEATEHHAVRIGQDRSHLTARHGRTQIIEAGAAVPSHDIRDRLAVHFREIPTDDEFAIQLGERKYAARDLHIGRNKSLRTDRHGYDQREEERCLHGFGFIFLVHEGIETGRKADAENEERRGQAATGMLG